MYCSCGGRNYQKDVESNVFIINPSDIALHIHFLKFQVHFVPCKDVRVRFTGVYCEVGRMISFLTGHKHGTSSKEEQSPQAKRTHGEKAYWYSEAVVDAMVDPLRFHRLSVSYTQCPAQIERSSEQLLHFGVGTGRKLLRGSQIVDKSDLPLASL